MKVAKILHNPKAGDEGHEKHDLIKMIEAEGYECRYSSTKKDGWQKLDEDIDIIVVVGGDGTVRKLTSCLVDRKVLDKKFPIGLIPLGTANNISKTLHICGTPTDIITTWRKKVMKKFDVGVCGLKEATFFLESFGYGLFPYLMKEMGKMDKTLIDTPEKKMGMALQLLHHITSEYEPRECKLKIDGKDYSGTYIMAEVMNIQSIGPNLRLSPNSDPGDGILEVVVVPADDKENFSKYVKSLLSGTKADYDFKPIQATEIQISWNGTHVHIDDEIIKIKDKAVVDIYIKPGLLEFFIA